MICTKSIKLFLFGGFLFCCLNYNAQSIITDKDNEFDKKYTPVQNSPFNNLNTKNTQTGSYTSVDIKNSIKFCPTLMFRQKVAFFYEVQINKGLSLNFGLGKAFGVDLFEQIFFDIFTSQSQPSALQVGDMLVNSKFYGSSPIISVGMRVYYSGKSFDGGFIDLNYRHERVDYTLASMINSQRVDGSTSISFKMNNFSFGFGHTFLTGHKNNITHELFMNLGIKLFTYPKFEEVEINSGFTTETVYRRSSQDLDARILPSLNIGYVIGFGF